MSYSKKIVKNTSFLLVADIVSRILSFFLIIFIARYLGDKGLGQYSFLFAFVGLFEIIADFGISIWMVREVARNLKRTFEYFNKILSLKIALAFISAILPIIAMPFLDKDKEIMVSLVFVALAYFFTYLKELGGSLYQAHEQLQYYAIFNTVERLIIAGLGIPAMILGYGIITLSMIFFIAYFTNFLLAYIFIQRKIVKLHPIWDFRFTKTALKKSLPFWLTSIFILIYFRIDTVMLSIMKNYEVVGWYNAAYKALDAFYFIPGAVIAAVFPIMSRFHVTNKGHLKLLYKKSFYYLFALALPMGIGITMLASRIIPFVYKGGFSESILALQILIWAEVFIFVSAITGYLLNSINQQKLFTYSTAFCALLNIILNFMAIPKYGHIGASITTVITEGMNFFLLFYFVKKKGYSMPDLAWMLKPVIATIAMAAAVYYMKASHIIIIVCIAALVYFTALLAVKGVHKEDISTVKEIIYERSS